MKEPFKEIGDYKGYTLTQITNKGVVWSDEGGWLDCVFDNIETAKFFIDLQDKFVDNFYNVIYQAQNIAIEKNKGNVSIEIINGFKLK